MADEKADFFAEVIRAHKRVNPCFMTGKGCVYTEIIDRELDARRKTGSYAGFLVVPYQPNLSCFFDLCFNRYLRTSYNPKGDVPLEKEDEALKLIRADQVRRTGYVICEKICKRIQESDFVVVDVSVPNPNVFYELGLAYGANQKIIVLRQAASQFGKDIADHLSDGACKTYAYQDLNPLLPRDFPLSQYVWYQRPMVPGAADSHPSILLFERYKGPAQTRTEERDTMLAKEAKDIRLDFRTHVMAAVGVAIDNVLKRIPKSDKGKLLDIYQADVKRMRTADVIKDNERFNETLQRVHRAFCIIIRTGPECDPMSYFWLGYCHALGKNVIPITVLDTAGQTIDDLAFDIRALWHMTFLRDRSDAFAPEIEEILYQMIVGDFSEWSRRCFWDQILTRRGKVSIFTGALHNEPIGREMIGDWDLRAVSELTSFFAIHQYRAVIESPVYQIEFVQEQRTANRQDYLSGLEKMLEDKNCVIIASPDVNPLTELVLGRIYGIPPDYWFTTQNYAQTPPHAVVAVKEKRLTENEGIPVAGGPPGRFFYREEVVGTEGRPHRGFRSAMLTMQAVMGDFVSQTEPPAEFTVHAHLVIAPNPFRKSQDTHEPKYIIVLNGVSGPATFALTSALTGGAGTKEFQPHATDFDRESESESILQKILKQLDGARQSSRAGFQCVLSITVGPAPQEGGQPLQGSEKIFDWRLVKKWAIIDDTMNMFPVS